MNIEQEFAQIFDRVMDRISGPKEIWIIKINGKAATVRSGINNWNSERSARQAWANHVSKMIKFSKWNPKGLINLPAGTQQKDFTAWAEKNKLVEFERIL